MKNKQIYIYVYVCIHAEFILRISVNHWVEISEAHKMGFRGQQLAHSHQNKGLYNKSCIHKYAIKSPYLHF